MRLKSVLERKSLSMAAPLFLSDKIVKILPFIISPKHSTIREKVTLILTSERLNLAEERPDFNKIFPKKSMDCFSNHDLL